MSFNDLYKIEQYKCTDKNYEWAWEMRFRIVDAKTNAVIDDAQGHGYKTENSAKASFMYKHPELQCCENETPNSTTKKAFAELENGEIKSFTNIEEMLEDLKN